MIPIRRGANAKSEAFLCDGTRRIVMFLIVSNAAISGERALRALQK